MLAWEWSTLAIPFTSTINGFMIKLDSRFWGTVLSPVSIWWFEDPAMYLAPGMTSSRELLTLISPNIRGELIPALFEAVNCVSCIKIDELLTFEYWSAMIELKFVKWPEFFDRYFLRLEVSCLMLRWKPIFTVFERL